jgi:hypothetical protein
MDLIHASEKNIIRSNVEPVEKIFVRSSKNR